MEANGLEVLFQEPGNRCHLTQSPAGARRPKSRLQTLSGRLGQAARAKIGAWPRPILLESPCFNRTVLPWETPLMIINASEQGVAVIPFSPALSSIRCVSQTPLATIWRSQLFAWPSVKGKRRASIGSPAAVPSTLSSRIFKKAFVPRRCYHPDKRADPLLGHPEPPCSR